MPALVATKLTGTLKAEAMKSDAWIGRSPFQKALPVLSSREARLDATLNWIVAVAVVGLLIYQFMYPRANPRSRWRFAKYIATLAVFCGLLRFASAKTTEIQMVRGGAWYIAINSFRELDGAIQMCLLERTNQRHV